MFLLTKLTDLLPVKAQPYAKSLYPALVALVGTGVQWASTGTFDANELKTIAGGAVLALVSFGVPNGS